MRILTEEQKTDIARRLGEAIGVSIDDTALAVEALTHPSYTHEDDRRPADYNRLEFLGDTVVNLVVGDELFRRLPHLGAGMLTQLRARVIKRKGLYRMALRHDLGSLVLLGQGEEQTGGRSRPSTLADLVESVVAAVYLEKGFIAARDLVLKMAGPLIEEVLSDGATENPKGELQQRCQQRFGDSPRYDIRSLMGPEHAPHFVVAALLGEPPRELGVGEGTNRRVAEVAAARAALLAWDEDA